MAKKVPNNKAGSSISAREPFQGSNMEGYSGAPRSHGWLSGTQFGEQLRSLKNPDYTVNSYNTPIAVHHEEGWHYPDVSHSPTTAKHQSIVRRAIGVKNSREVKMDERAAKRKAKAEANDEQLWNS